MKKGLLISSLLVLMGCTTYFEIVKQPEVEHDMEADNIYCRGQSRTTGPSVMLAFNKEIAAQKYEECMTGKGYRVQRR